jgi:hypothetical protein
MMRRKLFITASLATIVSVLSLAALASNPHFVTGPTFTLNPNGTVTSTGSIAVWATRTSRWFWKPACSSPRNAGTPPVRWRRVKLKRFRFPENRRIFARKTAAPFQRHDDGANGGPDVCPNPKWDPQITGAVVQSVTLTVYQGGQIVLQQTSTP